MKNAGREFLTRECKRCGWKWIPRKEKTVTCPKCKSAYWDIEKKKKDL